MHPYQRSLSSSNTARDRHVGARSGARECACPWQLANENRRTSAVRRSDLDETHCVSDEQVVRRDALALLIVVAPSLLLGAVLTISLFGAYFGLSLLLVTVPPAAIAWRARTAPSDSVRLGRFAIASALVAGALTLATIASRPSSRTRSRSALRTRAGRSGGHLESVGPFDELDGHDEADGEGDGVEAVVDEPVGVAA